MGCPVQGTELDSMNRVSPFQRKIFHGSVIPLSPAGLSHPRQRDQAAPHIPCCPGSSVQVRMPTGDHEWGWAGCPQVPSGPSWRQGKAGGKGTASSGQPQFLLCGFTSLWERAQEPCEAWGTQAAPPACPLAVSHAIMHHFWVTTWAWGALCPNSGPHSLHTSDRTRTMPHAWEQPGNSLLVHGVGAGSAQALAPAASGRAGGTGFPQEEERRAGCTQSRAGPPRPSQL